MALNITVNEIGPSTTYRHNAKRVCHSAQRIRTFNKRTVLYSLNYFLQRTLNVWLAKIIIIYWHHKGHTAYYNTQTDTTLP